MSEGGRSVRGLGRVGSEGGRDGGMQGGRREE